MAVTTAIVRAVANTALGTQDFTVAGFGMAKAAIFIMTYAIADDVAADHANFSYGATDGVSQFNIAVTDEDGQNPTDSNERVTETFCIVGLDPGTLTEDGEASFDSFITDGIRINWDTASSTAFLITAILFGGDDLSAFVGSQVVGNAVGTAHIVADVGFESHLVFSAMVNGERVASPTGSNAEYSIGAIHNDAAGGVTQRSYALFSQTGQSPSLIAAYMSALYGCMHITIGGAVDWGCEWSAFTGSGFTITERIDGGNTTEVFYLCLRGASPNDFSVGTHSTPVVNGEDSETGPNFEPQLVILGMTHIDTVNTGDAGDDAGTQGIAAFTDTAEFANSNTMEDNVGTSNTQSLSAARAIESPLDDGLTGISADFVSMDTLGYTLDYSATLAAARQFWYAAIKTSAVVTREPVIIEGETSTLTERSAELTKSGDLPAWRWISTYLLNSSGANNMAVDGSGGNPQSFFYTPPANYDFIANRMVILLITSSAMTLADYGNLGSALGQGIEVKANGVLINNPWQSNIDMYTDYYDESTLADVSDAIADTTMAGRWTFTKDTNQQGILIPNGQIFEIIVNDDLSSLTELRMKIKGKLIQAIG